MTNTLSAVKQQLLAALGSAPQVAAADESIAADDSRVHEWQQTLAAIWAEVLQRPTVSASDNYFHLGGNSVLSILITAKARAVGIPLTTPMLLANPTLKDLVHALIAAQGAVVARTPSAQPHVDSEYPLTSMQAGILHDCLRAQDQHLYETHLVLELSGALDPALLSLAWNQTFRANAVLANRFTTNANGVPVQRADLAARCDLVHLDCSASPGRLAAVLDERKALFAQRCRQLDRAPLCGLALLTVADDESVLLFTHHHLLLDGWSQQLVLQELFATYAAYERGLEAPHVEREPFARYVEHARARPIDAPWWQAALNGIDRHRKLTLDADDRRSTTIAIPVAAEAWRALATLSADGGVTAAALMQGLWVLVLAATAHTREVVYGLAVSGRDTSFAGEGDFSAVVGMCINTLPMRVKLDAEPSLAAWLATLQQNTWRALEHQHDALAEILRVTGHSGADVTLFESLLVIENMPAPQRDDTALRFRVREFEIREGLPIVLVVFLGEETRIELRLQPACCKPAVAERLQQTLSRAMQLLPTLNFSMRTADALDLLADRGPSSTSLLKTSRRTLA